MSETESSEPDLNVLLCCPGCGLKWEQDCEQAICIEKHGECFVCRFSPSGKGTKSGTMAEADGIKHERIRRMRTAT